MMATIRAKPITEKFWIVEDDGVKVGVLKINDQDKYVFSSSNKVEMYDNKKKLIAHFGKDFFTYSTVEKMVENPPKILAVDGYPTSVIPYNPMFDVKKKLPLFTKSETSKAVYCAGYYVIKFDKGWVRSFCPKLTTLEENTFEGPFFTELEMKQRLSYVSKSN